MNALMKLLERRTLSLKLVFGYATLLTLLLVTGIYNLSVQRQLIDSFDKLYTDDLLGVSAAKDTQINYLVMGRELRQAVLAQDPAVRASALQEVAKAEAEVQREIATLRPTVFREENKKNLARFEADFAAYRLNVEKVIAMLGRGAEAEAIHFVTSSEFRAVGVSANAALSKLTEVKETGANQSKNDSSALGNAAVHRTTLLLVSGAVLSVLIGWLITVSIRNPSRRLTEAVEQLAHGELNIDVPHTEYGNETGTLARSIAVLQTGAQKMEAESWVKSNLTAISASLQSVNNFTDLSQTLFSHLAPMLRIGHGAFYIFQEDHRRLRLLGSYALRERKSLDQYFDVGQGLVGQCAMERTPIILTQPPADYVRIGSSLGEAPPSSIAVTPIVRGERLLGVLEIATLDSFGTREQTLLDGVMPVLAMNLEILERNVRTNKLLEETRRQATAMQEQAATLEEQTVELEAQKESIQATEAWYRGIIESAPDGLLVADEHGIITMVNPRIVAIFGYAEHELIRQPIEMLVPANVRQGHPRLRASFMEIGNPRDMGSTNRDLMGVRKDGTEFPVEVGLSRLPAVGGRGVCVCASVRDITDRRAAEQAVIQERLQLRRILENSPVGVSINSDQGTVVFANHQISQLLGRSVDEVMAQNTGDFWKLPQERERFVDLLRREGKVKDFQAEVVHSSGESRTVLISSSRISEGESSQMVSWIYDVTERQRAQEAMRIANAEQSAMFEATTLGIAFIRERIIVRSNHRLDALFGVPHDAHLGKSTRSWYSSDAEYASGGGAVYEQLSRGEMHQREQELVRADGSRFWCLLSGAAIDPADLGKGTVWMLQDITDRKRMEEELKRTNFLTDVALELTGSGYWYVDYSKPDQYYQSERAARILGEHIKEDGLYNLDSEWFARLQEANAETAALTAERYQGAIDGKYPSYDSIYAYKRPIDGEIIWVHAAGKLVRDPETNKIQYMYGAYQDITAAKAAEAAVMESEHRLAMALKGGNLGWWDVQVNPTVTLTNDIWCEMLGYQNAELDALYGNSGDRWLKLVWPDDLRRAVSNFTRFVNGELENYRIEMRMKTKSGEPLWVLAVGGAVMRDEHGKVTRMVGIHQDISERKLAEEKVRESERQVRSMLDTSPIAVRVANVQTGAILYANQAYADMLHMKLEQLAEVSPRIFYQDEHALEEILATLRDGHDIINRSIGLKTFEGTSFWAMASYFQIDYEGNPCTLAWFFDVTELRRAREIAEEATKAKSDFLANMSHEIRTPMNAIIGMSHLALQTNLDKKQRNYVEKVHRSGENLLGIINDILDFSKIEAGKMSMETIDFRLEDVMDNLANLVGMKAEDKGLELLFNAGHDVPTALQGDPLRLGQVLINLGNNAVKFTDKGEIVVGIEKTSEDDSGVELHFWVKDSGIGMTPEQCGKMFQSFSQADASTTRKYGGTGLGLAISKNLVELMQGRIWVESEPGEGSSFHFTARFGVQSNPQNRRMFRAEELLGVRVLVVDDNASAREILSAMARSFGLEVDVAYDGAQALTMVSEADRQQLPYDLVFMDWKMPVMDGVETVRRLQGENLVHVPTVIMVTAYGREEAMSSADHRGVKLNAVLTKPVTSSTLLEAIGETLGKGLVVETRASEKASTHTEVMSQLSGARVLLVEDNEMNQELALELLRNAGMEVVLANNGKEAVDILAHDADFDGVLMDCQMPVMDGYTATREIRKNPAFEKLPVVAMTANAMAGDREKVIEAGMWDHIAKPLNVGDMFATIAKWIKPGKERSAAGATNSEAPSAASATAGDGFGGVPGLPGIDVRAGMATTMDNEKLYRRLLAKFRESQTPFEALFREAQSQVAQDASAPARAAHTLKGTAGNIGAKGVQAAAGDLEQACLDHAAPEYIDTLLAATLTALKPVIEGLAAMDQPGAAPQTLSAQASQPAQNNFEPELDALEQLLRDSDAEAADQVNDLMDKAKGTHLAIQLRSVERALEAFDFDEALAQLQQLRAKA